MTYVLITAAGIALCSLVGAVIGFLFENIPPAVEDALSGAAAGIMLCAAILGLVVPSVEFSGAPGAVAHAAGHILRRILFKRHKHRRPAACRRHGHDKRQ